jgi:oligosaccharide reducing-end xylanase
MFGRLPASAAKAATFRCVLFDRSPYLRRAGCFVLALNLLAGCTSTVDSLGHDKAVPAPSSSSSSAPIPASLKPLMGPDTYDNAFHDLLNYTTDDIDSRVEAAFQQLFHGDQSDEPIYYMKANSDNEAYIWDAYHSDVRTEGLGIGMLIAVELDHQDEFDKLWNFNKHEQAASGAQAGYYLSSCDEPTGVGNCLDPYGLQMFAMALIFAHDRWNTSTIAGIDYERDALAILDVMLHKEDENGGIVAGITNTFDAETLLVFDEPKTSNAAVTRPSILMPAFYKLWSQATGNQVFSQAGDAARDFLGIVGDGTTGLMPLRAYFDGTPVPGSDTFQTEAYRVFPNMVLDQIWSTDAPSSAIVDLNRVLAFFLSQGFEKYGSAYQLDGTLVPGKTDHEIALVLVNGMTALKATTKVSPPVSDSDRQRFIQAVWNQDTVTGDYRYYQGILQLFALCVLSGKMQVL